MSRRSSIDENSIVPVNDHVEKVFEAGPDANGRSGWVTVTNRENYTLAYTQTGLATSIGRGRERWIREIVYLNFSYFTIQRKYTILLIHTVYGRIYV